MELKFKSWRPWNLPRTGEAAGTGVRALLACLALVVLAGTVSAGIVNTKHNLVHSGRKPLGGADPTEICAFCHTPHGEQPSQPLWNRSAAASQTNSFVTYDSFGRSNLSNSATIGSVSLACLSCHDGTQAINVVSNMYDRATGVPTGPAAVAIDGLPSPNSAAPITVPERPVGVDVDHSHPVGVPYRGVVFGGDTSANSRIAKDPVLDRTRPLSAFKEARNAVIDDVSVWWLDTGAPGRQRTDVHLYSRPGANGESLPYIECSSCHDPHAETHMFLRMGERRTPVCMACHDL